jgi:DNA-binding NarL/FixJ family response regulator
MNSVAVIDDHDIVRVGLENLINDCPELHLIGSASSLTDGLALIHRCQPALVVSDMALNDSKGLDTVRAVVNAQGERHTLIVSMHDELLYGEKVIVFGASGYLMKESAHAKVIEAALTILNGQRWVSPRLNAKLLNRLFQDRTRHRPSPRNPAAPPSLRELDVLMLLKQGKTTKEIAYELNLSARTVDIHRANMKKKFGLRSGAELIAFASQA